MIYQYKVQNVHRVVDGDTVWLNVDLGFNVRVILDFRLEGLNAPEVVGTTKVAGLAAKAELERLLSLGPLRIISTKTEKYGRYLATIWVLVDGSELNVNQALIDGGFATIYS